MRRNRRHACRVAGWASRLAVCAVCALSGPAMAQAPAPAEAVEREAAAEEVFFESLEVTLVNLEVFVTDREGRRVKGLTADDFTVREDGRQVTITHFYAAEEGTPVAAEPAPAPGAKPAETAPPTPPVAAAAAPVPRPESQRLSLIVYVDNLHIRPFNRNKVMRQVRSFLARHLAPGDRAMLVTFERTLHVRQPFTSDMAAFSRALDEIETLTGFAVQAASERREVLRRIEEARTPLEAEGNVEFYANSAYDDAVRSIDGLKDLAGSLAGLPGRKALLYVSDGLPMTPGDDLYHYLDLRYQTGVTGKMRAARFRLHQRYRELTAQANANRVTFYTLQASGLAPRSSISAEYGLTDRSYLDVDVIEETNLQEPLLLIAEDTGGLAAVGTSNFDGVLDEMAADLGTYYSLGFEPAVSGDGRYHRIEVEVDRPGLTVRHRSGYRDKTALSRLTEGTLAALLYGAESNPLEVEVALEGAAQRRPDGHYGVPLAVRIPLGRVTLVPQGSEFRGALRVALAVTDAEGGRSGVEQAEVPIAVPTAELARARGQHFVYAAEVLLREGHQLIAIGVRDAFSGESSFLRLPLRVGG